MKVTNIYEEVVALRRQLHLCPELAFHEDETKALLMNFLKEKTGLKIVDRGCWFYALRPADAGGNIKPPLAFRSPDYIPGDCGYRRLNYIGGEDYAPYHRKMLSR